jgi:putative oxidoreductase
MEIGLFIIHVWVGALLMGHGAQKLFGLFGGYGIQGTGGFMESLGMRPGPMMAFAAGASEFFGGLLLALGLFTPLAATLIAATMFVATLTAHRGKGLWATNSGAELPLTYAIAALGLAFNGAGKWSLDHAIGWNVAGFWWGFGAFALALIGAITLVSLARHEFRARAHGAPAAG